MNCTFYPGQSKQRALILLFFGFLFLSGLSVQAQAPGVDITNPINMGVYGPGKYTYKDVRNTSSYGDEFETAVYYTPDIFYKFTITDTANIIISTRGSGWDTFITLLDSNYALGRGITIGENNNGGCIDFPTDPYDSWPADCNADIVYQEAGLTHSNLPPGDYYIVAEGGYEEIKGVLNLSVTIDVKVPAITNDNSLNFIRTWTPLVPEKYPYFYLWDWRGKEVNQTTQYFDELGRPSQTVIKQGSMETGSTPHDLVSPVYYDASGRESKQYLPFATIDNNGYHKSDPLSLQKTFYDKQLSGQGETIYYSIIDYEASPLNRVAKAMAPGDSWAGSNRGVEKNYWLNTDVDAVRKWTVTDNAGNFGRYTTSSVDFYPAKELYKKITVDEAGKQVIEFKDKNDLVILKKMQLTASPDLGSGSGHAGWLCTYYIYDDFNQLRAVLQPKAVELLASNGWQLTQTILDEYCFRYEYDDLSRNITKKVPGASAVQMIYDQRDRLVMIQDANLLAKHQWSYVKYDALNRTVSTGLLTDNANYNNASYHRQQALNSTDYPNINAYSFELLTENHYDDYDGIPANLTAGIAPYSTTGFLSNYNAAPDYPQPILKSDLTKGLPTWSKVKILGSNLFVNTVNIYDNKGRVVQGQSYNEATTNKEIVTTQYSWSGQALRSLQKLEKGGANAVTLEYLTTYNYDDLGRVSEIKKKIGSGTEKTIAKNEYNALGQLKKKTIAPEYNSGAGLESLVYDYNIRGWLLGVNRTFVKNKNTTSNYFGFDLGYDKQTIAGIGSYAVAQFNGNITGTVWKSKGDNEIRKYDFSYDAVDRLTGADFNQYTNNSFNKAAKIDFSVSNLSYDANGNILSMSQMGLKGAASALIDNLTYSYENNNNSNRLQGVVDDVNDKASVLGDFKYDADTKGGTDYNYDVNGNLISDANKKIASIAYNYLNLPQLITTDKGTIEYVYDAVGTKLKKIIHENGKPDKTTLYIGGAVFENDVLQFVGQEEGRIRALADGSFVFDYFLKDHLGNVRMVLTEEQKVDQYPALTFEIANKEVEAALYENVDKAITSRPQAMGSEATNGNSVQLLQKNIQTIGGGKLLKVMSGDALNVKVDYYFPSGTTNNSNANGLQTVLNSLVSLIDNGAASTALKGGGIAVSNNLSLAPDFTNLLAQQGNSVYSSLPKAYLNVLFFDEQFNFVAQGSQVVQVSEADSKKTIVKSDIAASKNGYVYVYVSNESSNLVYFDNLQLSHTHGPILEETHYYPFGLAMAGISSKALSTLENKYKFNEGTELNSELEVNLYETAFRGLDPQLGRFWQIDPLTELQYSWTPYHYALNNPISFNDPFGLEPGDEWLGPVVVVGYRRKNTGDLLNFSHIMDPWMQYNQMPSIGFAEGGGVGGSSSGVGGNSSNITQAGFDWNWGVDMGLGALEKNLGDIIKNRRVISNAWYELPVLQGPVTIKTPIGTTFDVSRKILSRAATTLKFTGVTLGVIGLVGTSMEIYDGKKNLIGEGGLDLLMGGVGFIPGGGWIASGAYFGGKAVLTYFDLDFWNE